MRDPRTLVVGALLAGAGILTAGRGAAAGEPDREAAAEGQIIYQRIAHDLWSVQAAPE